MSQSSIRYLVCCIVAAILRYVFSTKYIVDTVVNDYAAYRKGTKAFFSRLS